MGQPSVSTSKSNSGYQSKTDARRVLVAELAQQGKDAAVILKEVTERGFTNPKTHKPYGKQTIINDMQTLREIVGRYTYIKPIWGARVLLNVDKIQTDYIFWDLLRRGKAEGYEMGALYALPITQIITSYVLGEGIQASLVESPAKAAPAGPGKAKAKPAAKVSELQIPTAVPAGKPNPFAKKGAAPAGGKAQALNGLMPPPETLPDPIDENSPIEFTNNLLRRFMRRNQGLLQTLLIDLYGLGDQYVIVNPDATLSVASPETVTVEYSPADYRTPVRYIIRTKLERAIVEDVYTDEGRTLTIKYSDRRKPPEVSHFENLIGCIPIIHFANDRSTNEIYGRPIYEALMRLFSRYDDLLVKVIDGVELLSNPIPTFTKLDNIQETIDANSVDAEYKSINGTTATRKELQFDRLPALFIGKNGEFQFSGPAVGFTTDIINVLQQLFLLMLNFSRIPEFMWGGAISSSKASAETQLPPFVQYIASRRLQVEGEGSDDQLGVQARGGLLQLIDVWLKMYKLLNKNVVAVPAKIEWPELSAENEQIRQEWVKWADQTGKITPERALQLSGIVDDAAIEVQKAKLGAASAPDFSHFADALDQAMLEALDQQLHPTDDVIDSLLTGEATDPNYLNSKTANSQLNDKMSLISPGLWQHQT